MKQLFLAILVGVAIAGVGLAAEGVFAKPVSLRGIMIPQVHSASQHVHALPPIIVTDGD